jgi:hypothetical protein
MASFVAGDIGQRIILKSDYCHKKSGRRFEDRNEIQVMIKNSHT